jgi:hypothetical protein
MNNFKVVINGLPKKIRRKRTAFYEKRFAQIEPGKIARINIYNWRAECNTPPQTYINRMFKGYYEVIESDEKGFIVKCLQRKERFS